MVSGEPKKSRITFLRFSTLHHSGRSATPFFRHTWGILLAVSSGLSLIHKSTISRSRFGISGSYGSRRRSSRRMHRKVWISRAWRIKRSRRLKSQVLKRRFGAVESALKETYGKVLVASASRRIARAFARRLPSLPWPKFSTSRSDLL